MNLKTSNKSFSLILLIIIGALLGSILGEFLGSYIPSLKILSTVYTIGTDTPLVLDLKFMSLTFGATFNLNIMTIVGAIVSIILYKRH